MTTEELIRNACKAAGIEYHHEGNYRVIGIGATGMKVLEKFIPGDDDGDSRLLQVACKIGLHFEIFAGVMFTVAMAYDDPHTAAERIDDDANKAARMAVLRCAAMIGEAMP